MFYSAWDARWFCEDRTCIRGVVKQQKLGANRRNRRCPVCCGPLEALYSELSWTADPSQARVVGWLCVEFDMQVGTQGGVWVHFRSEPNDDYD